MPFGGMLGSTFNFVFENQLEKLQDGDRFYYLERTAGLDFNAELENNSFAKLIMANTDATHLPGDVFSTPAFILEVDQTQAVHRPRASTAAPIRPAAIIDRPPNSPLVIRDNPDTAGADTNYLHYTGDDTSSLATVVLGGTDGNDIMIASDGDDTLWGDGGNDRHRRRLRQRPDPRRRRRRHHHRPRRRRQHPGRRRQRRHPRRQRHQPDHRRLRPGLHRHRRGCQRVLRRPGQRLHLRHQGRRTEHGQRG